MEPYELGQRLTHYTGSVWEVVDSSLPGDGETWSCGMILCEGDYVIRCVALFQDANVREQVGREIRVHADYLHGDGWRTTSPV